MVDLIDDEGSISCVGWEEHYFLLPDNCCQGYIIPQRAYFF